MPKLVKGTGPISRDERYWTSREEHDAWVREFFAKHHPDEEPARCSCGLYSDDWLVLCGPKDRATSCPANVDKRIASHHQHAHDRALAEKRKLPSLGPTPSKHCGWCKQPIVHGRVGQRGMHDGREDEPNCRRMYYLHTDLAVQQGYLLRRDGLGCKSCGVKDGHWYRSGHISDPARWRSNGPWWERRYPPDVWVGEHLTTHWVTTMEVDHNIALALAWEAFSDDRRRIWFFSPANLALLCRPCHVRKSAQDRALIREAYERGPEWTKARVLQMIEEAGLLTIARPKGAS